jgi:hypothetical protein
MDKLLNLIRNELIIHLEFYGRYPYVRVGWVWIIVAFFFFSYFSYLLCGTIMVIAIYNLINRR